MVEFSDTVAVVTGGSTGIGRETARAFAERGASVVIGDVNTEGAEATVDTIESAGGEAIAVETDVGETADVEAMVDAAVETFGGLDYAFNNAGIGGGETPTAETPEDHWTAVLDVNLRGVFRSVQAELPAMLESGGGAIVNNASVLGQVGFENAAAYTAAKHGVLGLTKTAAMEYAEEGVRVNAVCPGFIETPMLEEAGITTDEEMRAGIEALHPAGRLGDPDEIADAVLWLCSEAASFVTGTTLDVDGGYLAR
jgi:NAD(P)-dependent dehydrogenase (short-subunit alcohol dehydrogenase family)